MKVTGESGSCGKPFDAFESHSATNRSGRGIRQRPQHHGVDDGVDRGGGAGAEAEHKDSDQRERRMLAELPGGGAKGVEHGRLRAQLRRPRNAARPSATGLGRAGTSRGWHAPLC